MGNLVSVCELTWEGNNVTESTKPQKVNKLASKKCIQVSCGSQHTACLTETGKVITFGLNQDGRLGIGGSIKSSAEPVVVKSLKGQGIRHVFSGGAHMMAFKQLKVRGAML